MHQYISTNSIVAPFGVTCYWFEVQPMQNNIWGMSLPSKPPQSLRAVGLVPGMFLSPFTPPGPSCPIAIKAATADGDDMMVMCRQSCSLLWVVGVSYKAPASAAKVAKCHIADLQISGRDPPALFPSSCYCRWGWWWFFAHSLNTQWKWNDCTS